MKKTMELQKVFVFEPIVQEYLSFEFTEDDFLLGKKPEFSCDISEDDE